MRFGVGVFVSRAIGAFSPLATGCAVGLRRVSKPHMNKKHVLLALVGGMILGLAYGKRLPVLPTIASKLPGATL